MSNNDFDYKLPQLIELRQQMYNQILGIQVFLANMNINDLPSDYDKVMNLYELLKKDYEKLCVCIGRIQECQAFNSGESLVVKVTDDLKPKIDYGAVALSNEMEQFHSEKSKKKHNGDFNPMLAAMY